MKIPMEYVRLFYHAACTVGEVVNGCIDTRLSKICSSPRVNFWAKYKPVKFNYSGPEEIRTKYPYWWRATDNMCGIKIPHTVGDVESILNSPWSFDPPTGGANAPYRLDDFRGYNPEATYFITGWLPPEDVDLDPDNPYLTVRCAIISPTQADNLQPTDSPVISQFRLGLKITGSSGKSYIQTSDKTIAQAYNDSAILQVRVYMKNIPFISNDVFTIKQFLTPANYSSIGTFPTIIDCYSIPNYWKGYVNQIKASYKVVATGLDINCEGLSSSLSGTYRTEDYYMKNPYQVSSSGSYEYWKLKVHNWSKTTAKTFTVEQLVYHAQNINGDDVECSYYDDMKLYNSSMSEVYQITVGAGAEVYAYIRTRLFGKNATPSSGMTPLVSLVYALLNLQDEGINDRKVARFEAMIQGA